MTGVPQSDAFTFPTDLTVTLTTTGALARNTRPTGVPKIVYAEPPTEQDAVDPLRGSFAEFARPAGANLVSRTAKIVPWIQARREARVWPYARAVRGGIGATAHAEGETSEIREGLNFATQDYLSLSSHPAVLDAAAFAIRKHGLHSGGSSALQGRSDISRALEREIGDLLEMEHVVLFSSGWGAAYGVVTALIRPYDHIVMDRLAHSSLQAGAAAATSNISRIEHLSTEALRLSLQEIRATDSENGILVITEGLFSMDSDSPDLRAMQSTCREFGATLLVDCAHDFGSLGPEGSGHIGREEMLGEIDIVMGAFSKTFGSNGGFVATRHAGVRSYVEAFGGPHAFSNSMSPVQIATVRESLRIVRSVEGDELRSSLMTAVHTLRASLGAKGIRSLGDPSAVVPVMVGHTGLARLASGEVLKRGLFANLVEFPAVGVRAARFRLQVQASHTPAQTLQAAEIIVESIEFSKAEMERHRTRKGPRNSSSYVVTPLEIDSD
jgi:glycine C-acetyltransferase